jgi:flagellar biosynthesis protein FliR
MAHWLDQFHIFLLILLRISALLIVAPIFGHRMFPAHAKIGLALAISLVFFPMMAAKGLRVPAGIVPYAWMMGREIVMGTVLGFAVMLLFIGVQFAGQLAGLQIGFGIVNVIDPQSSEQVSIIGQFLDILAILILLTTDGHHLILRGLSASFETVPLGGAALTGPVVEKVVSLSSQVFVIAVQISAPVLLTLFLISVALGFLARTVPQMNVFIVGFPVQVAVGLAVLFASLPLFQMLLGKAMRLLERDFLTLVKLFA